MSPITTSTKLHKMTFEQEQSHEQHQMAVKRQTNSHIFVTLFPEDLI